MKQKTIFDYVTDITPYKLEQENAVQNKIFTAGHFGYWKPQFVNVESDLKGQTRYLSKCNERKFNGNQQQTQ